MDHVIKSNTRYKTVWNMQWLGHVK